MAAQGQQHPIKIYVVVWIALFFLSAGSYMMDFFPDGALRLTGILLLMVVKAGAIVAVFMHMKWERTALQWAILIPPVVLLVFVLLMATESFYSWVTRVEYFGRDPAPQALPPPTMIHEPGHQLPISDSS